MKVIESAIKTIQITSFIYQLCQQLPRLDSSLYFIFILSLSYGEFISLDYNIQLFMSQLEKIRNAFSSKGFREKALINQQEFLDLLNELKGRLFEEEVALEIWEQASLNSHQEATVEDICSIIEQAQNILQDKLIEVQEHIEDLLRQRREIEIGNIASQQRSSELQRINIEIQELKKDRQEYQSDLMLVTQPFGIDYKANRESHRPTGLPRGSQSRKSKAPAQQNTQLQHLFYVVLVMAIIQVIVIYKKYDFLNLLVLLTAMSVFMLNYFDNTYLKLCGGMAGVSVAADFTWLIMYGGSFWSPPILSQHSSAESGYLKFIVLLTFVNIAAKIYLVYLILKQGNIEANDDFTINPFEGVTLKVQGNHGNIITKSCKGGVCGYL